MHGSELVTRYELESGCQVIFDYSNCAAVPSYREMHACSAVRVQFQSNIEDQALQMDLCTCALVSGDLDTNSDRLSAKFQSQHREYSLQRLSNGDIICSLFAKMMPDLVNVLGLSLSPQIIMTQVISNSPSLGYLTNGQEI